MSLELNPSPQTLDKAVRRAVEKIKRHGRFGTAVFEAAQDIGIDSAILYREMSRRSAVHRRSLAQKSARARDRRAA